MSTGEFETLAKKVELTVVRLEELKRSREELKSELHAALERAGNLEKDLAGRREEISELRRELDLKAENISMAGERIRGLVTRLDEALA